MDRVGGSFSNEGAFFWVMAPEVRPGRDARLFITRHLDYIVEEVIYIVGDCKKSI
jgi:hypothetical protein